MSPKRPTTSQRYKKQHHPWSAIPLYVWNSFQYMNAYMLIVYNIDYFEMTENLLILMDIAY